MPRSFQLRARRRVGGATAAPAAQTAAPLHPHPRSCAVKRSGGSLHGSSTTLAAKLFRATTHETRQSGKRTIRPFFVPSAKWDFPLEESPAHQTEAQPLSFECSSGTKLNSQCAARAHGTSLGHEIPVEVFTSMDPDDV